MALPPARLLLLLLLRRVPGAAAQVAGVLQVLQPQDEVSVSTGTTLTLQCTVLEDKVVGSIKWLKDSGGRNETVYDQKGSGHRATRIVNSSDTNYDISISNVQVEDAGTYYCVKFKKGDYQDEVFLWGKGTKVLVNASPVEVAVSGPTQRAEPGSKARFTCSARGFFPADIQVRWLKNGHRVPAPKALVFEEPPGSSFAMSSALDLTLAPSDVRTQLSCEVSHSTLRAALRRTYNVSDALRVPPTVRLLAKPSSTVEVNKTVNLSCSAEGFYPNSLSLTWLENGLELPAEAASPAPTAQGTFELQSSLAVQAALERNQSVIACRVVHDAQSPVSRSVTLHVTLPPERGAADPSADGKGSAPLLLGFSLGLLLEKGLLGLGLFQLFKRSMASAGKGSQAAPASAPDSGIP
ncbi:signal-regulatory protein beta-1-like [Eudromia elegans]